MDNLSGIFGNSQPPIENVLIATPAYGCMIHMDCHNFITGLYYTGVKFQHIIIGNESLITRARNKLISFFYTQTEFTHLFFLDADIGLHPNALPKLLSANVDVIGVPIALKGFNPDGTPVLNVGKINMISEQQLANVDHIGTAALLISRNAVSKVLEICEFYTEESISRGTVNITKIYDVFKVGILDNNYLSEDFWFCKMIKNLGMDIFADFSILASHAGNYHFFNKVL